MGAALSGGAGIVTPHPNTILCCYIKNINNTVYTYTLLLLQHYIYNTVYTYTLLLLQHYIYIN